MVAITQTEGSEEDELATAELSGWLEDKASDELKAEDNQTMPREDEATSPDEEFPLKDESPLLDMTPDEFSRKEDWSSNDEVDDDNSEFTELASMAWGL